jgi:uncharacterized protein YkwD
MLPTFPSIAGLHGASHPRTRYRVRRCFLTAALLGLAVALPLPAHAAGDDIEPSTVWTLRSGAYGQRLVAAKQAVIFVDGAPIDMGNARLVESGGRLMVPLRPLGEALGARVTYNARTLTTTITKPGLHFSMRSSDAAAMLMSLRNLCEMLGAQIARVQNNGGVSEIYVQSSANTTAPVDLPDVAHMSSGQRHSQPERKGHEAITAAHIQHNLKRLNAYRARAGVPPLQLDERLNAFALEGSRELMRNHIPHKHFSESNVWEHGFEGTAAENQGDPNGWFPGPVNEVIDDILQSMMNEGPGGGHHDAIINPTHRRVGIGLVKDAQGRLYLTNNVSG